LLHVTITVQLGYKISASASLLLHNTINPFHRSSGHGILFLLTVGYETIKQARSHNITAAHDLFITQHGLERLRRPSD
jgi:hypothetical protein